MTTSAVDPRTPVIVGVGQRTQRPDDPSMAMEAVALMTSVVEAAADDAGARNLLHRLDAIGVVNGAWKYSDPGRLVGEAVGSPDARTILSFNGGNTPQSFVNSLATRIARGQLDVAVIVGAETIWSRRRQRAAGQRSPITEQTDVEPDERFARDVVMSSEFEASRGLAAPIDLYPVFESAIRADRDETIEDHRTRIAQLWAGFNAVATENPYAWSPTPLTADEIRTARPDNRMVGFPYTKALNSNWDLDQGAALLLCSAAAATAAGVPRDRWVFPYAGTDAHDTYLVSNRRDLHSSPAIEAAGRRLFELTGLSADDCDHLDIYSCFPSAVQIACAELDIDLDRQLTVTGGLPFAGGPLNNYVTHSIAAMCDVLRDHPEQRGLVTANGGYVTKHALGMYSATPPPDLFRSEDVQRIVDEVPTTPVDERFTGTGTIEGYTVMHDRSGPTATMASVRTPAGQRTWARSTDLDLAAEMMIVEGVGRSVEVAADGDFALR